MTVTDLPPTAPRHPGRGPEGSGRVPIQAEQFKAIMTRWASGITIVTARSGPDLLPSSPGLVHGMTASSFTSVSLDPPLVLVCVNRRHLTHRLIESQRCFGVNILAAGMHTVSDRCAGFLGEEAHWLDDLPWHPGVTGAPLLDDALAWMDCTLWSAYAGGDHTIFVGEIQGGGARGGDPLLWCNRRYAALAAGTNLPAPPGRTP